jgi:hypothetical protein
VGERYSLRHCEYKEGKRLSQRGRGGGAEYAEEARIEEKGKPHPHRARTRRKSKEKTQVKKRNLGHPQRRKKRETRNEKRETKRESKPAPLEPKGAALSEKRESKTKSGHGMPCPYGKTAREKERTGEKNRESGNY